MSAAATQGAKTPCCTSASSSRRFTAETPVKRVLLASVGRGSAATGAAKELMNAVI